MILPWLYRCIREEVNYWEICGLLKGVCNHMAVEITRQPVQSSSSDKHWTHQNPSTATQASADHKRLLSFPHKAGHYIFLYFLHRLAHLPFCFSMRMKWWLHKQISYLLVSVVFSYVADSKILSCLEYRHLYNHCPGPEWNIMCRGCCEYDVIRCKCPLQGTPVGYAVPCCRNAINECDPCIIHPGTRTLQSS